MTSTGLPAQRKLLFSPLKRFQKEHCQRCDCNCGPNDLQMFICVLTKIADALYFQQQLTQKRFAHL